MIVIGCIAARDATCDVARDASLVACRSPLQNIIIIIFFDYFAYIIIIITYTL